MASWKWIDTYEKAREKGNSPVKARAIANKVIVKRKKKNTNYGFGILR